MNGKRRDGSGESLLQLHGRRVLHCLRKTPRLPPLYGATPILASLDCLDYPT